MMNQDDADSLERFVLAQAGDYDVALRELKQGQKQSHWIWYILPQLRGLGRSSMAQKFGVKGRREAVAYLQHEVLGPRLRECISAILEHKDKTAEAILGSVDAMKLRSCLTLFAEVAPEEPCFQEALDAFFGGERDSMTLELLSQEKD